MSISALLQLSNFAHFWISNQFELMLNWVEIPPWDLQARKIHVISLTMDKMDLITDQINVYYGPLLSGYKILVLTAFFLEE